MYSDQRSKGAGDAGSGFLSGILQGQGVALAPWARYGLAVAIFAAALVARFLLLPVEGGLAFLTFYPAVALAALLCGTGPGLMTVLLGAVLGPYVFMDPHWSAAKFEYRHLLPASIFGFSGVIICLLAHQMRRHAEEVKQANLRLEAAMADLARRETELARLNERLTELDQAKTEFFANVSHEFRTPLTLMLAPLEDLLAGPPSPVQAALEGVHRNALRLTKLVNALLDFARIEAGRGQANPEATDLAAFTAELASNFRSACDQAGLALVVDCPPLPGPVRVDRTMWEKIVLNLVSNAFKFTFEGRIEVRLGAADRVAELVVADSGTGIPADELPHIFERFHRVKGSRGRSFEGSGIGLALVDELVRLHGGSIRAESEEGRGSRFIVRIPVAPAEGADAGAGPLSSPPPGQAKAFVEEALRWLPGAAAAAESGAVAAAAAAHGRVVVADDNADMRDYIRRLLAEAGYGVEVTADGEAALAACAAQRPDLVLSDVMMPGLDGFDLLARLRGDEGTATLPVILLSARAGQEARIEGLAAGADDYLVKPFQSRELVARVEGAIRLARARQEAQAKIARAMAELERSNRALDEFAYIASHDLKEPLRGIHGYAAFLREDYADRLDEEGRHYLDRLQRLAERESALIDRLLAYSRLGSVELHLEPVDLDAVVDEVASDLEAFLAERRVELRRPGRLPTVACDPRHVGEVFQNLITNAAKYNDKALKWVEVSCDDRATPPVFHVRDNGIGIAPQHFENVFRIFKRLHEQDKYGGGTGAGLTIVKKIVERHGGRIWLESTLGEGTTFHFTLSGE